MKIRIFENVDDSVLRIVVNTENFSQDDIRLMCQYGEPEVNVGGMLIYSYLDSEKTKSFGNQYVRILHGFPFAFCLDSRDFENGIGEAIAAGEAWKASVRSNISDKMRDLRDKSRALPTEEVYDNI